MAKATPPKRTPEKSVKRVVHLSTNIGKGCDHCSESTGLDKFAGSVNHYIQAHGYELIHVGEETEYSNDGRSLWHSTIAVLGRTAAQKKT
jgi:hypothetical protein